MAIDIKERKLPITPREARDYLQWETDNFGVFFDKDRCYELSAIMQLEMLDISRKCKRITRNVMLNMDDKNSVIDQLITMGVRKGEFLVPKAKDLSLTDDVRNRILNNPGYSDDVHEFCKLHGKYVSDKRNKGNIENFANVYPESTALSKLNHRMSRGCPLWSILSTSRLAAKDPGVQGIPRSMPDILCEPKGYTLKRCDSGQIEPRINFSYFLRDEVIMRLIMYYKDAYFGILNFCVVPDNVLKAMYMDFDSAFKPIDITDEIKNKRQSIKRLTNAGSYGSANLDKIEPELAAAYEKRIIKLPARLAFEQQVRDAVGRGEKTFYGYFGTPVTPSSTEKYTEGEDGWHEHLIRCGINNPVQTTASELMFFSINRAREVLSRAKDTHICFYKHDEAIFYVSDEDMANGIGDELDTITAYNVEGWIPIEAEPITGVKKGDYPSYIM